MKVVLSIIPSTYLYLLFCLVLFKLPAALNLNAADAAKLIGKTTANALPLIEEVSAGITYTWNDNETGFFLCFFCLKMIRPYFDISRWPGCRTPRPLRLLVHWISKATWLAVSICFCVESSLTPIPPIWPSVYSHLDRWLTRRQFPLRATVQVSAAASSFIKQSCHTGLLS